MFEPSLQEVEDSMVFVVAQIAKTMQSVPHLKVRGTTDSTTGSTHTWCNGVCT